MAGNNNVTIIKKIKKGGHGGHHGGAWKVAYADFVTAMMAFFLLMWLINTTTPEQKRGIADYFAPEAVTRSESGNGAILSGTSASDDGQKGEGSLTVQTQVQPPVAVDEAADDSAKAAKAFDTNVDRTSRAPRARRSSKPRRACAKRCKTSPIWPNCPSMC